MSEQKQTLNQKLWQDNELIEDVADKLELIAFNFVETLKEDEIKLEVKDIVIVGSNANFNYNETSDIDLHIIADMSDIEDDEEKRLLCILYNAYKSMFNTKYDIKVKEHEVEIYVEPDETAVQSGGIYSLYTGWIKKPSREVFVASDEETEEFEKQFKEWEDRYKEIIEGEEIPEKEIEEALIHPEHYNKKVEIIVGNALSREIERRFGSDIIEKEIREKNSIRYVVPYDQRLEHFIKQFKSRSYKILESITKSSSSDDKVNKILEIEKFIEDLYELRKQALKNEGESSVGNKVFKEFRKLGYLKTLKDIKISLEEKEMSLEALQEDTDSIESTEIISDEELFWHLRDGLVDETTGEFITKTKYSIPAKKVIDVKQGNIYVKDGKLELFENPKSGFAVSPEQYPTHLLDKETILKFKEIVKGTIVMFYYVKGDKYGKEYSVYTMHEEYCKKALTGELGKEFAIQQQYGEYVNGSYYGRPDENSTIDALNTENKVYNKEGDNMKIKKEKVNEEINIHNEDFVVFDNTAENINNYFKHDAYLFAEAIKTGQEVYGDNGGYDAKDKYVVVDTSHPFGTALYSTSDEEVVKNLKQQHEDSKEIKEEKEKTLKVDLNNHEFKEGQKFKVNEDVFYADIEVEGSFEDDEELVYSFIDAGFELRGTELFIPKGSVLTFDIALSVDSYTLNGFQFDVGEWSLEEPVEITLLENSVVKEGGQGSGNFKSGAQRYNDKKDKIFSRYNAEQERFAKFLLDHEVSAEEVEKLKQDSGLNGNPLAQKYFELKKSLKEEVEEPELPTTLTVDVSMFVEDDTDLEEVFLSDAISDWLSDEYGFCHFGFDYEIEGDKIRVYNIAWDTSCDDDLDESLLTEGTSNFGSNKIIDLCSPEITEEDYAFYVDELREEEPDITDEEIAERIQDVIQLDYQERFERAEEKLSDVDEFIKIKPGYYEGYYIDFNFDNGFELAENWIYYTYKDETTELLKNTVEKMRKALKACVDEELLVKYRVSFRASNGETGYSLEHELEKIKTEIDETMNELLKEGLKAIEENMDDDIE